MVDDINGIFSNNKIGKVFSSDAFEALANFNPLNSLLLILIVIKTALWIVFSVWGWRADKKFLAENPHMRKIDIAELIKSVLSKHQL